MSIYHQGFARVAAVTVPVHLAWPEGNLGEVVEAAQRCDAQGAAVAVFPELCLTGRTAAALFADRALIGATQKALRGLIEATRTIRPLLVVGAPLEIGDALYNCAVFVHQGRLVAITPKMLLSREDGHDEHRFFSAGVPAVKNVFWDGHQVPFGAVQVEVAGAPGLRVAAEIGEELLSPVSPGAVAALRGALVIANPVASPALMGLPRQWDRLVQAHSQVTATAYISAAAGHGESSTNLAWQPRSAIYEAGMLLAQKEGTRSGATITVADIDLQLLAQERRRSSQYRDRQRAWESAGSGTPSCDEPWPGNTEPSGIGLIRVEGNLPPGDLGLYRPVEKFPFLAEPANRDEDYHQLVALQAGALARRMEAIGKPKLVIGVSGGLDSAQALLVAVRAMELVGRSPSDVLAFSMPGFGTSPKTRLNAEKLSEQLAASFEELDIRTTAQTMLAGLKHPFASGEQQHDVTFENVQAGLRTDYLFRLANHHGGIVVGTGDLSELALGWCTYGVGDHMSHYGVNAGLPKTLIQDLIRWEAGRSDNDEDLRSVLEAIVNTEISPELIPTSPTETAQATEEVVGPYELHDFTLFYLLRYGFGPRRIAFLTQVAWGDKYPPSEILHWLETFYRRFFANQFKRSALPDGPRLVMAGSLSPRTDWPMPSDALARTWLAELDDLQDAW